jgi:hypothetical protein
VLQLAEVQLAVAASLPGPDRDSLISLQSHIEELITLTKENLTGLQDQEKERDLLQTGAADQYDKEYALLKVSWKCEVISKPTNAHKHMTVYCTHCVLSICFSHSCDHLQGYIHQNVTEVFEPKHRYKILYFQSSA